MGFQVFLEHGPLSIVEIRFRLNFTCSRLNIRTSCRSDGRKSAKTPSSAFKLDIWMARLKNLCFGIWTTLHFEIWTGPYFKSGPFYTKCAQYGPLLQIILKHVFGPQFKELILIKSGPVHFSPSGPFCTKMDHFSLIWTGPYSKKNRWSIFQKFFIWRNSVCNMDHPHFS